MNTSLSEPFPLVSDQYLRSKPCFSIDVTAYYGEFSKLLIKVRLIEKVLDFDPSFGSYSKILCLQDSNIEKEWVIWGR